MAKAMTNIEDVMKDQQRIVAAAKPLLLPKSNRCFWHIVVFGMVLLFRFFQIVDWNTLSQRLFSAFSYFDSPTVYNPAIRSPTKSIRLLPILSSATKLNSITSSGSVEALQQLSVSSVYRSRDWSSRIGIKATSTRN